MNPLERFGSLGLPGCLALVLCTAPAVGQEAAAVGQEPDPRADLAPGMFDAEEAAWNLRLVANAPPPERFVGAWNSDLAFTGDYVTQGNWLGFQIWDISDATRPELVSVVHCPGAQNDVSVVGDLLFLSVEAFDEGTTVLFTDEWGGGTQPKCRPGDPPEWGANAIFTIQDGGLEALVDRSGHLDQARPLASAVRQLAGNPR